MAAPTETTGQDIMRRFSVAKMLLPVVIGLGITGILIWRTADLGALQQVRWTWSTSFWMVLALFSLVVRDWMYMVRIRHLTDKKLDWFRAFVVIMLWEFASALAPGMIGGGFFFAIWFLTREGIDTGTSITVITFTSFLDGIFLAIMAPLVYFLAGILHAFPDGVQHSDLVVYAKQVVMGIIVLLSPTPGGSGLAEFIFNDFLGMYVASCLAPAIALLWRLLSYYPYILIGAILLPRWVRRNVIKPLVHPSDRGVSSGSRNT